jgi:hypothetical protein
LIFRIREDGGRGALVPPCGRDQAFLLPPDMREWLPDDHLVWLVLDIVPGLDCSALHARHPSIGPRGERLTTRRCCSPY